MIWKQGQRVRGHVHCEWRLVLKFTNWHWESSSHTNLYCNRLSHHILLDLIAVEIVIGFSVVEWFPLSRSQLNSFQIFIFVAKIWPFGYLRARDYKSLKCYTSFVARLWNDNWIRTSWNCLSALFHFQQQGASNYREQQRNWKELWASTQPRTAHKLAGYGQIRSPWSARRSMVGWKGRSFSTKERKIPSSANIKRLPRFFPRRFKCNKLPTCAFPLLVFLRSMAWKACLVVEGTNVPLFNRFHELVFICGHFQPRFLLESGKNVDN